MSQWERNPRVLDNDRKDRHASREGVDLRAATALRHSAYSELSLVSCDFEAGVLTLRGQVSSYYLKQMAQNLVWKLEGVHRIDNQLVVAQPPSRRGSWGRSVTYSTIRRHPR